MWSNLLYSRITVEWATKKSETWIEDICDSVSLIYQPARKGLKRSQRDRQKLSKIYTRNLHFKSLGETFFCFVSDNDPMLELYATHNSLNQLCYMTRDYIDKFIHFFLFAVHAIHIFFSFCVYVFHTEWLLAINRVR